MKSVKSKTAIKRMYKKSDRFNNMCDVCGWEPPINIDVIEAHHIMQYSDGGKNEIDNIMALCPNCHSIFHHVFGYGNSLLRKKYPKTKNAVIVELKNIIDNGFTIYNVEKDEI